MTTIVLVPGFWLGAWVWDKVAGELRAAGHEVHQVELTGLGTRTAEAAQEVDLRTHIADVVATIEDNDLHRVVLVGHSGANMPVTGAADRVHPRLERLVYVDTGPLPSGMAHIEFEPPHVQQEQRDRVASDGAGWRLEPPPFDPASDPVNLAGLDEEQLASMRSHGTAQPFATSTMPLDRLDPPPAVPASLVMSTFSPDQVREMADGGNPIFGLMSEMDMYHLPTGHWPMLSRPADLAAVLDRIATADPVLAAR